MMNAIHHDEMPSFYFPQSIFNAPAFAPGQRQGVCGRRRLADGLARARSLGPRGPLASPKFLSLFPKRLKSQSSFFFAVLGVLRVSALIRFTTADAYAFTRELEQLHPDNRHVRDKIRQQLQVLRDMGLLIHVGRGDWRLP